MYKHILLEDYAPTEVRSAAPDKLAKEEAQRYLGAIAAKAAELEVRYDALDEPRLSAPGDHPGRDRQRLRSHHHGLARPQGHHRRAGR